jgi:hypothetical protein
VNMAEVDYHLEPCPKCGREIRIETYVVGSRVGVAAARCQRCGYKKALVSTGCVQRGVLMSRATLVKYGIEAWNGQVRKN